MNFKTRTILQVSILFILTVLFFMSNALSEKTVREKENRKSVFPGFNPDTITGITFTRTDGRIEFFKDAGSQWRVKKLNTILPVQNTRINDFLSDMKNLMTHRIASGKTQQWGAFGVDAAAGESIIFRTGNDSEKFRLFVGNPGSGSLTVFIRNANEQYVYETNFLIRRYLEEKETYWQDLRLFPKNLTENDVVKVSLRADFLYEEGESSIPIKDNYTLARITDRNTTRWIFAGKDIETDQREADDMIRNLISLEGSEFIMEDIRMNNPDAEIIISTGAGKNFRLTIGEKTGERYHARVEGTDYVYSISEWRIHKIVRPLSSLMITSGS